MSANLNLGVAALDRTPRRIYRCDMRQPWPLVTPNQKTFQCGFVPIELRFDTAIRKIAHPTGKSKFLCAPVRRVAEPYTLDAPTHDDV